MCCANRNCCCNNNRCCNCCNNQNNCCCCKPCCCCVRIWIYETTSTFVQSWKFGIIIETMKAPSLSLSTRWIDEPNNNWLDMFIFSNRAVAAVPVAAAVAAEERREERSALSLLISKCDYDWDCRDTEFVSLFRILSRPSNRWKNTENEDADTSLWQHKSDHECPYSRVHVMMNQSTTHCSPTNRQKYWQIELKHPPFQPTRGSTTLRMRSIFYFTIFFPYSASFRFLAECRTLSIVEKTTSPFLD